jgi:hypothetical protein
MVELMERLITVAVASLFLAIGPSSYSQTIDAETARTKALSFLNKAGVQVNQNDLVAVPFESRSDEGHLLMQGWKVRDAKLGVLMRMTTLGEVYTFTRIMRLPKVGDSPTSDSEYWARGDQLVAALRPLNTEWVHDKLVRSSPNPRLDSSLWFRRTVRLTWRSSKDSRPSPVHISMRLTKAGGELIEWTCFVPDSYGPDEAKLTPGAAKQRAQSYVENISERTPTQSDAIMATWSSLSQTEPKLVWSRGGGAFQLDEGEQYFVRKELRLAYAWQGDGAVLEVDANSGELLTAAFETSKLSSSSAQGRRSTYRKPLPWALAIGGFIALVLGGAWIRFAIRNRGKVR